MSKNSITVTVVTYLHIVACDVYSLHPELYSIIIIYHYIIAVWCRSCAFLCSLTSMQLYNSPAYFKASYKCASGGDAPVSAWRQEIMSLYSSARIVKVSFVCRDSCTKYNGAFIPLSDLEYCGIEWYPVTALYNNTIS